MCRRHDFPLRAQPGEARGTLGAGSKGSKATVPTAGLDRAHTPHMEGPRPSERVRSIIIIPPTYFLSTPEHQRRQTRACTEIVYLGVGPVTTPPSHTPPVLQCTTGGTEKGLKVPNRQLGSNRNDQSQSLAKMGCFGWTATQNQCFKSWQFLCSGTQGCVWEFSRRSSECETLPTVTQVTGGTVNRAQILLVCPHLGSGGVPDLTLVKLAALSLQSEAH